jgi:hypothetical protein
VRFLYQRAGLALLGATLPASSAFAQTPPPLPVLPLEPGLKPFPEPIGLTIRQFDCRTYWMRSSEPPHRFEQQTACYVGAHPPYLMAS